MVINTFDKFVPYNKTKINLEDMDRIGTVFEQFEQYKSNASTNTIIIKSNTKKIINSDFPKRIKTK